jgi:hypothetical protein
MDWLTAVAIPVSSVVGGLVGVWLAKRSSRTSDVGSLLNAQFEALYAKHPRQRQAARDIIRSLERSGKLSPEQLKAANIALTNWTAVNWRSLPAPQQDNVAD